MPVLTSYYTALGIGCMIIIGYLLMGFTPNLVTFKRLWVYHNPFLLELDYYNECANVTQILTLLVLP